MIDIYANWKAEIRARNWSRVHISGDKREPLDLGDASMRQRGGKQIVVRRYLAA